MLEKSGNIWDYRDKPNKVIVITTNSVVRANGEAIMGKGVAAEAALIAPAVPRELGKELEFGQRVCWLDGRRMLAFPTKLHWRHNSPMALVARSARELRGIAEDSPDCTFIMPRPGCGNGGLKWEDVRPLLASLPDNVWVVHPA